MRRGRQQVAEFFQAVDSVFEIQRFDPETFIAQGDRVVVLGTETSRVKATDKILDAEWAHSFTLRDGKVVAFKEYIDTAAVVAELQASHART
jgi:ketosteroid isomerase-like protein